MSDKLEIVDDDFQIDFNSVRLNVDEDLVIPNEKDLTRNENTITESVSSGVYLIIIPDLHLFDKNLGSCVDYVGDMIYYMNIIRDKIKSIEGDKIIIFSGDIFHSSFTDIDMYFFWVDYIRDLRNDCVEMFATLGNHEKTYYKSNPFWRLMKTIGSTFVKSIKDKVCEPMGQTNILNVVDAIAVENCCISFGHHGYTPKPNKTYKKNVLVSHNSVISKEISSVLKNKYDRDPLEGFIDYSYINNTNPFEGFDYVYNGHMHKAFSQFTIENEETGDLTKLQYLASIGRTNKLEYNDLDLTRLIPVLYVRDGVIEEHDFEFNLKTVAESLDLNEVEKKKKKSDLDKEYKRVCKSVSVDFDPIEELKNQLPSLAVVIDNCIAGVKPKLIETLEQAVNRPKSI